MKRKTRCEVTGKIAHAEFYTAARHLRRLVKIGENLDGIVAYRCVHCKSWHVGHTRPERGDDLQTEEDKKLALRSICKLFGNVTATRDGHKVQFVWDYAQDKPVLASEMPAGSERWKASEYVRWRQVQQQLEAARPVGEGTSS
jgi:hypothetical protein